MPDLSHFAELGLSSVTLSALEKKGFEEPTDIQSACIPLLLKDDKDVIGQAQTGTGKTAAFALPILETIDEENHNVQAIILAPTRELAIQVAEETASLKGDRHIEIAPIYGGASMELQLRKLRKGVQIVVGTPGRILDHLERKTLDLSHVHFAVLDEADEMLDMGFIEDIENILSKAPAEKRMLLFSATMPQPILKLAERFMRPGYEIVRIAKKEEDAPLTDQIYFEVREGDKLEALTRIIDMEESFYGVVFCRTKVQCDEIGRKLNDRGYDAEALHGDLNQKQRETILNKMRNHQISILVATDVAARGIDIQDLTHVINYTLPQDPEIYIHRIGRTGRAGKQGTAITFVTPSEFRKLTFIKKVSKSEIRREHIPQADEIIAAKKTRLLSEVSESLSKDEDPEFCEIAKQLLSENDGEKVIAALLSQFYKGTLDASRYRDIEEIEDRRQNRKTRENGGERDWGRPRNRERYDRVRAADIDEQGLTRLFIARGRGDGLTKRDLANIIIDQAGVRDEDLQGIQVMENFSFINAPFTAAERILDTFKDRGESGKPLVTKARPEGDEDGGKRRGGKSNSDTRRSHRNWEEDYQPYGRDTQGDDEGARSFGDRKRRGDKFSGKGRRGRARSK